MDPVITPLLTLALGKIAQDIIKGACEDYLKDKLKSFFGWLAKFGGRDKLELAYQDAMEKAYSTCLEMLLQNIKGQGYSDEEIKEFTPSLKAFIKDKEVAGELLRAVREPGDNDLPSPEVLGKRWDEVGGKGLPPDTKWSTVAAAFRRQATKQVMLSADLRELLNAHALQKSEQHLGKIKQLIERSTGVVTEVQQNKYYQRMLTRFSPVDLANLMPAYANDPGRMVIRDVFIAQSIRENPPPVEIPKDLMESIKESGLHEKDADNNNDLDEQQVEKLRNSYVSQSSSPVLDVIATPGYRLLVLTGEPGSGKSTLMRYLLTGIIKPPVDHDSGEQLPWVKTFDEAFPLLIELRDFHALRSGGECDSFMEYVAYMGKTDQWFIDDCAVHKYLTSGPSLVMFDGLDEIFDTSERERVIHEIAGFAQRYERARIVVTSRPLGYKEQTLRNAGFAHFGIQGLEDEQVEAFVKGWFTLTFPQQPEQAKQRIERVLDSTRRSKPIRLLAGNPMLLTIMALLAREDELPRERAKFYEKAVEVLCHHWDVNRNRITPEDSYLNADDKKDLLRRIAMRMQTGDGGLQGNVIREDDLEQEIRAFLIDEQWQTDVAKARIEARRMIRQLRERNYILCLRGPKLYGFVHRTFLEYLTAAEYVHRFKHEQSMTITDLIDLFDKHCRDDDWREVLRLICGQIDEQFVGKIIEHLIELIDMKAWYGNKPLPELLLAIWCLSEVRSMGRIEGVVLKLADSLMQVYLYPEIGSPNFHLELLGAIKETHSPWPGGETIRSQAIAGIEAVGRDTNGLIYLPRFIVHTVPHRETQVRFLESSHFTIRVNACKALANKWPDENTRILLSECAVKDENNHVRRAALLALVDEWPDEKTRKILIERAFKDGNAASLFGKQDSQFGEIVFTNDLDGVEPYLDPAKPIPREHIEKAAEKANIPPGEIDETVSSLSAHMGWNITRGSGG
jgi:energy-coupling factor transporter ATP-binding protein EcfA2